ncbi:MAG: hypothetical protein J1E84_04805 [Muribaculaceae bacterium]|nr:hypothetical protein [Muribaculaceae bacterium]
MKDKDETLFDSDDELNIRSYCVLCHAAFEEFAESIALYALEEITNKFINEQRISYGLCTLLHFTTQKTNSVEDVETTFDYLTKKLREIKSELSKLILINNHGVSIKYLKKMLTPLGIDVSNDIHLISSLEQLAVHRGAYAHNFSQSRIKIIPSTLDLLNYVNDSILLMKKLYLQIENIKYFSYKY